MGKMMNKGMYTSDRGDWRTPIDLFNKLEDEFGFDIDVCASKENNLCPSYFDKENDFLKQDIHIPNGKCFMNPPYGRRICDFVKHAYDQSIKNNLVFVCLLPSRTDTRWFHEYCLKGEIRFIRGRLRFDDNADPGARAPFPSCIVIFK
jgi:phage N-6-adenine-methyltransferase